MPNPPRPVYLHGLPGSELELSLFGPKLRRKLADAFIPNRTVPTPNANAGQYFDVLAEQVRQSCGDAPVRLIGFSLGAAAAIQLATRLSGQVAHLDLVSAAAPLQSGCFIDSMAGGPLFKLAMRRPALFGAAVRAQSFAARTAPLLLFRALFARAKAEDETLRSDREFQSLMIENLVQSLGSNRGAYQREIIYYVEDWSNLIPKVTQPVTLWHGQEDDWTPLAMAQMLAAALPNVTALHELQGKSHFSTLRHYLRQLP